MNIELKFMQAGKPQKNTIIERLKPYLYKVLKAFFLKPQRNIEAIQT